jgi:hypothetical protein
MLGREDEAEVSGDGGAAGRQAIAVIRMTRESRNVDVRILSAFLFIGIVVQCLQFHGFA